MEIKTVGQLRQALKRFDDSDNLSINLSDDFGTYGIGAKIKSSNGPGTKDNEILFFKGDGWARIDLELTATNDDDYTVKMRAKVMKIKQ